MEEKNPCHTELCSFWRPQDLILMSRNQIQMFKREITSFSKITSRNRKQFINVLYYRHLCIACYQVTFLLFVHLPLIFFLEFWFTPTTSLAKISTKDQTQMKW